MKKLNLMYLLILAFSLPLFLEAQEVEKEVRVKMVKIVDGNSSVVDTVFSANSDLEKEIEWLVESLTDVDSVGSKVVRLEVISDVDPGHEEEYVVTVHSDENESNHVLISSPKRKNKVVYWTDTDGEEQEFEIHMETEAMHKELEREMLILSAEAEVMDREMDLIDMEQMVFLSELPPHPPQVEPVHHFHDGAFFDVQRVSEKELREAGVKNQPDLLKLDNFEIDKHDGVVTLRFQPKQEGACKVLVYNYFGDKVFTGKPKKVGEGFQITVDLSAKQPGTYYIQIVQKKASVTKRINQ